MNPPSGNIAGVAGAVVTPLIPLSVFIIERNVLYTVSVRAVIPGGTGVHAPPPFFGTKLKIVGTSPTVCDQCSLY